jgi:AraC-like DNA-binding protein
MKLKKSDLGEMMFGIPIPSFSEGKGLEDNRVTEKNCAACNCYLPGENKMFYHAREIIERQHANPPSLHNLALMVGTNECKLKNGFKALFGTTVFRYLFDFRMKLACQYMLDTGLSIQDIALAVGYEHQSHFSTAFKRMYGISPQEYRNRIKMLTTGLSNRQGGK